MVVSLKIALLGWEIKMFVNGQILLTGSVYPEDVNLLEAVRVRHDLLLTSENFYQEFCVAWLVIYSK